MHVIYRVNQANYAILIPVAVPHEYLKEKQATHTNTRHEQHYT